MHQVSCFLLAPPPSAPSLKDLQPLADSSPTTLPVFKWFLRSNPVVFHWKPLTFACTDTHTHTYTQVTTFSHRSLVSTLASPVKTQLVPRSEPPLLPPSSGGSDRIRPQLCFWFFFGSCFVVTSVFVGHCHARTHCREHATAQRGARVINLRQRGMHSCTAHLLLSTVVYQ